MKDTLMALISSLENLDFYIIREQTNVKKGYSPIS